MQRRCRGIYHDGSYYYYPLVRVISETTVTHSLCMTTLIRMNQHLF